MIRSERYFMRISNNLALNSFFIVSFVLSQQIFFTNGYAGYNYISYNSPRSAEVVVEAVEIPYPVRVGQTVQLKCVWRVGTKGFYSLRWYKDNNQFYSFIEGEERNVHQVDGIHVILKESDDQVVTLRGVTSKAEGTYKCEIMSDGPKFKIGEGFANLTVVQLPETPQLIGLRHHYMVADTLNVTCRAENGRPAPILVFRVNDVPIHEKSGRLVPLPTSRGDQPDVFTSETSLVMPLSETHHPNFKLGCFAYAHGLVVQKEVNIQVNHRTSFFNIFRGGSSEKAKESTILVAICICVFNIINFKTVC